MKRKEDALRWLEFAEGDIDVAEAAAERKRHNYALYHLQQAVEKSLKAVIIYSVGEKVNLRTHSIEKLVSILEEHGIEVPEIVRRSVYLTDYAFTTRYPDDYFPVSEQDYEKAYGIAMEVYEWAKDIVESQP